jgi:galactose-1-phosphate uridylyltransferase
MPDDRCELVLYTSEHDATFWALGVAGARRVIDLWAERFTELGARPDVDHVLIFENRGPEVVATIAHPHGQIYAYDHVPARPARLLAALGQHLDQHQDTAAAAAQVRALMFLARFRQDIDRRLDVLDPAR